MDFINKLIKKGIFGLVLCFSFFAFSEAEKAYAASNCTIAINDGDEYLVLNTGIDWSDSGVSVYCDSNKQSQVSVSVNGGDAVATTDSGISADIAKKYFINAGFYKVKYFLTSDETVSVTRNVRVLPSDLNSVRNIWVADFDQNTTADDVFVRVVDHGNNFIAIGNFGTKGYLVYFNSLGGYEWHEVFDNSVLSDITKSGDLGQNIYFLVGKNSDSKGFVQSIQVATDGINDSYGSTVVLSSGADDEKNITMVNKVVVSSNYVYAAGYFEKTDGTKIARMVRLTKSGAILNNAVYHSQDIESEYRSIITFQSDGMKVVAVGSTSISGRLGASGGLVTMCNEGLTSCSSEDPYIWKNSSGASTTITSFNDIAKIDGGYLIVGKSRVDRIVGENTSVNSGLDDSLVALLDESFGMGDVYLLGSSSSDELYSVKVVGTNKYVAVGKKASQGVYISISVNENKLSFIENAISGKTGNVEFRDVLVKNNIDEEVNFVFVGSTQSNVIEDVVISQNISGANDAVLVILDNTTFSNYENINVLQNAVICDEGLTSCPSEDLLENYRLVYGTKKIVLSSENDISSTAIGTFFAYHSFENGQGVKFILGRNVIVSANPVAPNISVGEVGIDKWYFYSRSQTVDANVGLRERQTLWTDRYIPVENNLDKDSKTTYYVISDGVFVRDTSTRDYTYNNYIKMAQYVAVDDGITKENDKKYYVLSDGRYVVDDSTATVTSDNYIAIEESLNSTSAFQSLEKAQEYALLQEFARVAFVSKKYNYETTGINAYQGETASLATQNYYFVYYIDLAFSNGVSCGTNNGVLVGSCTSYTGYAFSNLTRIKEIATLIINKYNHFVSQNNSRFNPTGNIDLPDTEYFKEELYTEKYANSMSISLSNDLYLEVTHYPLVENASGDFQISDLGTTTAITGQTSVVFSSSDSSDYGDEGRYVVRYCYSYGLANQDCGDSTSFVIDRTAPIINYTLTNGEKGVTSSSTLITDPKTIKTSMKVNKIFDIDPYAYTIVNGQKYYLQCSNLNISQKCIEDLTQYVNKTYSHDKEDANKIFNIVVYDRAGNSINSYFKVGNVMPKVTVVDSANNDSFVLSVEFFNRNDISEFKVDYTKSEECTICANQTDISGKILDVINTFIYINYKEIEKNKKDPTYEPNIVYSYNFTFSRSRENADGTFSGGLSLPKVQIDEASGTKVYSFVENETELLPISEGLYKFTIGDTFTNVSQAFGGIGLDKAELYVYVNSDDNAVEDATSIIGKIPVEKEIKEGTVVGENEIAVKTPNTYKYAEYLPDGLLNNYPSKMYFTNKFVYIKFKSDEFGIVRISKANSLNTAGGYGTSEESNTKLDCLFKIYGSNISAASVGECDSTTDKDLIPLSSLANTDYLNSKGIYVMSYSNGYYYLAFTMDGTYDIWSEVHVNIENYNGEVQGWTALPVYYSFTIDKGDPVINFEVTCSKTPCVGEKTTYSSSDFVNNASIVNIGNYNMKFKLDGDLLIGNSINRLMVVSINSEIYNAYSYSLENSDVDDGNFIVFEETGVYTVTFYDASGNSLTYKFIIDKTAPTIDKIEDVNGKSFSTYQQYVEVEFTINEGSFLKNNTDKNMITFQYRIDSGDWQEISVVNDGDEKCKISTGIYENGKCLVVDNNDVKEIDLSFVISINENEATRNPNRIVQTLTMKISDYFGNERTVQQSFIFDNLNPYIYFSDDYSPILDFGENVSNENREKMLSTAANASLGIFRCDNGLTFTVGQNEVETKIILCGDTPNMEGINNNVVVETYEAYRVSFNNYRKNADNSYTLLPNGTYLGVNDVVYKKKYTAFPSETTLNDFITNSRSIYSKGNYVQVTAKESIDPNVIYYEDASGKNGISIQDMFTNKSYYSTCNVDDDRKCLLYKMYDEDGTFDQNQEFYVYDTNDYKLVTDTSGIDTSDYLDYYYTNDTYKVDEGKYLPAVTLKNSCVVVNSSTCSAVKENRIKLESFDTNTITYYNIVNPMSGDTKVESIKMDDDSYSSVMPDNRIWQIAYNTSNEPVRFGFGLASNLGRPIIFVAKDGAGNISSNYLETVIAIRDSIKPNVKQVSSVYYTIDEAVEEETLDNYVLKEEYHKLYDVDSINCNMSISDFYIKEENGEYTSVDCKNLSKDKQYYIKVNNFVRVDDGDEKEENVDYYRAVKQDLGTNYLTNNNLIVEFDEPIYRIKCSFYVYDSKLDKVIEKDCSINNAEFDYNEEKTIFELIYEPLEGETNYFVNYKLTVYDFSNNSTIVNSLFIDREIPVIEFNDNVANEDRLEVDYVSEAPILKYDDVYLNDGFKKETTSTDSINIRISDLAASNIDNTFAYEVKYYRFNYGLTYKNYEFVEGVAIPVLDGLEKDPDVTYYVRIKKPDNYVLKGVNGKCEVLADGEYCYVKDNYNYYPDLLTDSKYWIKLDVGAFIEPSKVGVYKIEYKVIDHSGNISKTEIKTVYCEDTKAPTININGEDTSDKYGYHNEVTIKFSGEHEANLYAYKCKDGVTTCELPGEIFASVGTELELSEDSVSSDYESLFNEESIYKIYFHDKGKYVSSTNHAGQTIMVLKYNYLEYTFLIDRTSPELHLNAYEDENGKLFYKGHLNQEEYLYCVNADRYSDEIAFGSQLVECKNSSIFTGEWVNANGYINLAEAYEYFDGVDLYRVEKLNGVYYLYKNGTRHELSYISESQYNYSDATNEYILTIQSENYSLMINGAEAVDLTLRYIYKETSSNTEYKFEINGSEYKLYIDGVVNLMTKNGSIYEYRDATKLMSYSVRYINNKYQIKITNEKVIIRKLYNSNGQLLYVEKYEKLAANAQKYFYNTYYYMSGDSLVPYSIGASYDENNVYKITSIDLYFRADGKYLLRAQDKSGNAAGRRINSLNFESQNSAFIVDNTAPNYNNSQNAPTGVNYWFSVPSAIITNQNISYVNNVTKFNTEDKYYSISSSGLNYSFFYAFATKVEAESYLTTIYSKDINSMDDNTCTESGAKGFRYNFYNPDTRSMDSDCFVGKDGMSNKKHAQIEINKLIKKMVYPTFSANMTFGSQDILQKVCDSSNTSGCADTNMFKTIYLKIDHSSGDNKSIVETCTPITGTITCIKVNAKIVRYDSDDDTGTVNVVPISIGEENTKDTTSVLVYSRSTTSASTGLPSTYTSSINVPLNDDSYYIFEEKDATISYANYMAVAAENETPISQHFNTAYYAVYVAKSSRINVYYDEGNGVSDTSLTQNSNDIDVKKNVNQYYLILKDDGEENFKNRYEIYEYTVGSEVVGVYSYLMLQMNGVYYNINDYLNPDLSDLSSYYFKIPMPQEQVTIVRLIDRAGNATIVTISLSNNAPSIDVVFKGEGGEQTATVVISNTDLTSVKTSTLEVLFSTTGKDGTYSSSKTGNIRASLICTAGQSLDYYGCLNTSDSGSSYKVVISNLEDLYGFFEIKFYDNHGNYNSIKFLYNPADMNATYTNNIRFIDNQMVSEDIRMITNEQIRLEFDNQVNYVILYKLVGNQYVEVCNTQLISDSQCPGSNSSNKVSKIIDGNGQYEKSILYYADEGWYKAKIINRASEVIYDACFDENGVLSENCKEFKSKTYNTGVCSWDNNPEECDNALEIINVDVAHSYNNLPFNVIEIDTTAPVVDINDFIISLPSGSEVFKNNSSYTNAELTVEWDDEFVQLVYACTYVDSVEPCQSNGGTGFPSSKTFSFVISSNRSVKYDFWFEDYAGNTTINNKYSFTVIIVLPEISVYEVDSNGVIIDGSQVLNGKSTNKGTQLLCYYEGVINSGCSNYIVELRRGAIETVVNPNDPANTDLVNRNVTRINGRDGEEISYKYKIYVKNAAGNPYTYLYTEFSFEIDRDAPTISLSGTKVEPLGIYKSDVEVSFDQDGTGYIYSSCVLDETTVDYSCDEDNVAEFTSSITIKETGAYKVIAVDKQGNVTEGSEIKYFRIDKEKPKLKVQITGQYSDSYLNVSENGFTNAEKVIASVTDNNDYIYMKYRVKGSNDEYGEWKETRDSQTASNPLSIFEFTEEGFYEVIPVDAVGNEGQARHFIIYRQEPKYSFSGDKEGKKYNDILTESFSISWEEPKASYIAPIIKVTVNGNSYKNGTVIEETGEYMFVFTDLAGNIASRKVVINKNKNICLNNVGVTPRKQFILTLPDLTLNTVGFKFNADDVIIYASPSNYFGGTSACGEDSLNFRSFSYFTIGKNAASYANTEKSVTLSISDESKETIENLGGTFYVFVVTENVAKKDLDFPIGENFFTKDPIGWILIFGVSVAAIYVGIKLVFFRKKVRVLK